MRVLFCSGSVCAVVHALTDSFFRVPSLDPFTPVLRSSSLAVCGVAVRFDLPRMLCLARSVPAPAAYLLLVEPTSRVPFASTAFLDLASYHGNAYFRPHTISILVPGLAPPRGTRLPIS